MSNLIRQKTTFATDAQHPNTPHQQCPQEAFVKGLARLLRTTEAVTYVGLSLRTMEKHRTYGTGPVYRKLGNRVVYAIEDLDAWAAQGIRVLQKLLRGPFGTSSSGSVWCLAVRSLARIVCLRRGNSLDVAVRSSASRGSTGLRPTFSRWTPQSSRD
jgi:predicted DNA-binding transcriptional regulator AlpA